MLSCCCSFPNAAAHPLVVCLAPPHPDGPQDNWDRGFVEAQEQPEGYWMRCVQGAVPRELQGTLFR